MAQVLIFLFGLIVGSFLNVCIYRIPRKESLMWPGSHCPSCKQNILWHDNIPVLSFLLLKGRCRFCSSGISMRYPGVEILGGVSAVLAWQFLHGIPYVVMGAVMIFAMIIVTFIDFEHQIIPDQISLPGIVIGLVFSTLFPAWHGVAGPASGFLSALAGMLLGGGILYVVGTIAEWILKKEAMGGGDVKLLAAIGAFLGWKGVVFTLFTGSLLGSLAGLFIKYVFHEERIPFGPYLALGAMIALLWGEKIMSWYVASVI